MKCPECTANLSAFVPLSEYEMGRKIGTQLALEGMLVKYAITDGDARSAEGIDHALKVLHLMWNTDHPMWNTEYNALQTQLT